MDDTPVDENVAPAPVITDQIPGFVEDGNGGLKAIIEDKDGNLTHLDGTVLVPAASAADEVSVSKLKGLFEKLGLLPPYWDEVVALAKKV